MHDRWSALDVLVSGYSATGLWIARISFPNKLIVPTLLSINNYCYRRAGAESVFFDHNRLFENAGWEVVPFSMHHAENLATPWSADFAETTDGSMDGSTIAKISRAMTTIYSFGAAFKSLA